MNVPMFFKSFQISVKCLCISRLTCFVCCKKQQELIPALLQVLCNEGGLLRNRGRGPFGGTVAFHDEGYLVKSWGWSLHCHRIRWVCGFLEPFVVQCWQISATLPGTGSRAETFFFNRVSAILTSKYLFSGQCAEKTRIAQVFNWSILAVLGTEAPRYSLFS